MGDDWDRTTNAESSRKMAATVSQTASASYDRDPTEPAGSSSRSRTAVEVLKAQIDDVRVLGALLRPIAFAAVANFSISDAGIQVTTESERSVQAVAYVASSIFNSYEFTPPAEQQGESHGGSSMRLDSPPPSMEFDINLHTFLESLNIFGGAPPGNAFTTAKGGSASGRNTWQPGGGGFRPASTNEDGGGGPNTARPWDPTQRATTMRMRWRGTGYPLILLLEEQDVSTRCQIATFEPSTAHENHLLLAYHQEDTQAQAILPSEYLFDALQSVDQASCSKITVLFSNSYAPTVSSSRARSTSLSSSLMPPPTGKPILKLTSDGDFGTAETELPNDSSVLEKFTCARTTCNAYRWSHFARIIKAVQYAYRASIRVSDRGLMSIQLMMPKGTGGGGGDNGFLEFLIVPLDEDGHTQDDEDGDDGDEEGNGAARTTPQQFKPSQTVDSDTSGTKRRRDSLDDDDDDDDDL